MEGPQSDSLGRVAQDVLDSLLEGCQVIGFDFRYLLVNRTVVSQAKQAREDLLGRTMMEAYPGIESTAMFAEVRRCMTERAHASMENEFTYPDGSKGWFELRFVPVPDGVCILSLDITDKKRAQAALARTEEQLRQAQKMEAIGLLAGGVAHDFNNALSVILSFSHLVLDDMRPGDPAAADIEEIKGAGERAAALTRQLLAFSRQQVMEARVLDLNVVVTGLEKMLKRLIGAHIELEAACGEGVRRVFADAGQIEQVIMNLVVNARDAMPDGGKLTIETANVALDADYADAHFSVTAGDYVLLAVSDTGVGMSQETQARIFEPFFTTKETGKGTGLGLSMVYGIVKQSRGHLWVYSEPGHGSTFKVYLPQHSEASDIAAKTAPAVVHRLTGSETVLVAEDDDRVRAAAKSILRRAGYQVLEARNGGEALLTVEQHPGEIHLLLTDVVMAQMSGLQLAARLAPMRPTMKVLCMSGYTDQAAVRHGVIERGSLFLQKPITPDSLLAKVRQALES